MKILKQVKQTEEKLRNTFLAKKREAINLDIIKKQLMTRSSLLGVAQAIAEQIGMDALLTDINQQVWGVACQFDLFRPVLKWRTGCSLKQPISIKVTGKL